jgi:hypothetical protein
MKKRIKITESQLNGVLSTFLMEQSVDLPKKFEEIPGEIDNYRSSQPSGYQLRYILENYPIENVIQLNGESSTEKEIVESLGKNYYSINAHDGFQKDKGYVGTLDEVLPILKDGKTLIHCAAGKDRTGYTVAKHLEETMGWDKDKLWEYTTGFNSWGGDNGHICDPPKRGEGTNKGYIGYMEAFYPIEEWCKKYDPDCKCEGCKSYTWRGIPFNVGGCKDNAPSLPFEIISPQN